MVDALNALLVEVDFKRNGTVETFHRNRTKWYKSCHLKFAPSKLERIPSVLKPNMQELLSLKVAGRFDFRGTSLLHVRSPAKISRKVHHSTMKLDTDLRSMVTELDDTTLLARISGEI